MSASAIYVGRISHARRGAHRHAFSYRLYMLYLDLDELEGLGIAPLLGVEAPGLLSFRRRDYRGPASRPLKTAILDEVEAALGERPSGPVRLLTHVRSLGRAFNPVSFYYCYDADGTSLRAVLAEITNTPWNERHAYVLRAGNDGANATFAKAFHVSPFLPMEQRYRWRLPVPGKSLVVEMKNEGKGRETFRARLTLERRPLTRSGLLAMAFSQPLMSGRILLSIYWQAFRLWLKGAPFYPHPKARIAATTRRSEA